MLVKAEVVEVVVEVGLWKLHTLIPLCHCVVLLHVEHDRNIMGGVTKFRV